MRPPFRPQQTWITFPFSFVNSFCDISLTLDILSMLFWHAESIQNSIQNGTLRVPRGTPGASRGPVRARFQTQLKINEQKWSILGGSRDVPGGPRGSRGITKIKQYFCWKWLSKCGFSSISVHKAVGHAFRVILHRFLTENQWKTKNNTCFYCAACFF